jgi:hypothetical protein
MAAGAGADNLNEKLDTVVQENELPEATILLNAGADPNYKGESGITMLNYAIHNQNVPLVKLLLERGADVHLANDENHGVTEEDSAFTPLETVFIERYGNGTALDPNKAKHILFVLIYYGNALSSVSQEEIVARFPPEQIAWLNTTSKEIGEWVGDAAAKRREQAILARLKAQGILEGGRRKRKTLRKRRHRKHKTQRRLRRR